MPTFLYRCPNTGLQVQGWLSDEKVDDDGEVIHQSVTCPACASVHFINPKTRQAVDRADK
jgi:hypothetical protein